MYQLGKFFPRRKKGLSNMIAYVMLISITLALSVIVFQWLRGQVVDYSGEECPGGVSIVIEDYTCSHGGTGADGSNISATIKNKGRHSVDGFILGINDRFDADVGIFILDTQGDQIRPGEAYNKEYDISNSYIDQGSSLTGYNFIDPLDGVTLIQVQGFVIGENGEEIICPDSSSQVVDSCP